MNDWGKKATKDFYAGFAMVKTFFNGCTPAVFRSVYFTKSLHLFNQCFRAYPLFPLPLATKLSEKNP